LYARSSANRKRIFGLDPDVFSAEQAPAAISEVAKAVLK
jgi:hypothetical protein